MRQIELAEHQTRSSVALTATEAAQLQGTPALTLTPSTGGGELWDLRAAQYVGVIQTNDIEVRIHPKVPVDQLLFLLGYAADSTGWKNLPATFAAAEDLVGAVALAFLHHTERALATGLLQGYVTQDDALTTLRGRLREADQLRRRFSLPVPAEVRVDDFTPDILENQMLKVAARRLLRRHDLPTTARRGLRRLVHRLSGVSEPPFSRIPPSVRFTRLNQRYRPAIRLAELILASRSLDLQAGTHNGIAFLFDMNRVFEDFVTAAMQAGGRVQAQWHGNLDEQNRVPIRPDLTWWTGAECRAVADVKYKPASGGTPNADLYQMLAYCLVLGVPCGYLICPAGDEEPTSYAIRNAGVEVIVKTLDLAAQPLRLLKEAEQLRLEIELTSSAATPAGFPG
jgi:5-methylcytosine-specific restriction enzyme subunit McrC